MKITIQNPTQGPLITVSFDDEAATVAQAFSLVGASRVASAAHTGLTTLRAAAQFAEVAPGTGGVGLSGIAGPALFIGMFFAAGDAPPRKVDHEDMTPNQLRCMTNPYDTSAECAAVRSALSILPFSESWLNTPNPNAARASAGGHTTEDGAAVAVGLPDTSSPTTEVEKLRAAIQNAHAERDLEARSIVSTLLEELARIDARLKFVTTPAWMKVRLNARRDQIGIEMTDVMLAASGIVAPRANPAAAHAMTEADLKWPAPMPIAVTLPADHDPKNVPQDVLQTYYSYATVHEHTAVMLLWNPQERRYEVERGWPLSTTFDRQKLLVRTALPPVFPERWPASTGLGLTWYFVPDHEHLQLHERFGVAPTGPLTIDTIMRDDHGEVFVGVALEPLQSTANSATQTGWAPYVMTVYKTFSAGQQTHAKLLVAYERNSLLGNRAFLMSLQDILATPPEEGMAKGFVTPGVSSELGSESIVSVHLQHDKAADTIVAEFHAHQMPPTFNYLPIIGGKPEDVPMFLLVERDGQRIVYRFTSTDLIAILRQTPAAGPRLGEETHTIFETSTGKPATVRVVDGQFKSITIDGHTEWYDQPVNRIEIRR